MDAEIRELQGDLSNEDSVSLIMDIINDTTDDMMDAINDTTDYRMKGGDSGKVNPLIGTEFDSKEDARVFYNGYAKSMGFGTFKGPTYKSIKKSMVIALSFCCSNGGISKVTNECNNEFDQENSFSTPMKNVTTTKLNCKAHMRVKLDTNGKWIVSAFDDVHTHEFVTPSKVKFYRSHRNIPQEIKDMIVTLRNENAPVKQIVFLVTSQLGGTKNVTFIRKDVSNFAGSTMRSLFGSDVSTTLDYFKHLQAEDSMFFFAIKLDDFGRAQNIFWVDRRSRLAYQYFGDVITIDTTFMTNKYNMPFAPFVGTNHHWQSILFRCALIRDEQASSFEWIFTTWLEAIGGRHLKAMITDQDLAMKKAIPTVFPDVRHRFCE